LRAERRPGATVRGVSVRDFMERHDRIYTLRWASDDSLSEMLRLFAEAGVGGTIVVDEVDDADFAPSVGRVNAFLKRVIKYGGNHGQDFIGIGRRFTSIHRDVRTQVDAVITYRQPDLSEAETLVKDMNVNVNPAALDQLGDHGFTILEKRRVPMLDELRRLPSYVALDEIAGHAA
jgi:hypothetical protein